MFKTRDGRDIRDVVKREDWQELRKSFIGKWKTEPEKNFSRLREWLGNVKDAEYDKLIIVYNYLTGSGFRMGVIDYKPAHTLKDMVKAELESRDKK